MKTKYISACASLFALTGLVNGESVYGLTLPNPLDPNYKNTSIYALGDFYSYLLPVLGYQDYPNENNFKKTPYYIRSEPGDIKELIVIATGAGGTDVTSNPNGFDNAYDSSTKGSAFSTTNGFPGYDNKSDPGLKGSGNPTQEGYTSGGTLYSTWDADISALRTYLGGQKALFMFNHNETNSGNGNDQSLYVWAQLILTSDNPSLNPDILLDLTFNDDLGQTPLPGVTPEVYVNTEGFGYVNDSVTKKDWVYSPGQIEVLGKTINMNLGADTAAYAAYCPDLQAILDNKASPYTHLHGLFLMKDINNGYEQLFLIGGEVTTQMIPTPSSAAMGLGLLGILGGYRLMSRRYN